MLIFKFHFPSWVNALVQVYMRTEGVRCSVHHCEETKPNGSSDAMDLEAEERESREGDSGRKGQSTKL